MLESSILQEIVANKKGEVSRAKGNTSFSELEMHFGEILPPRGFCGAALRRVHASGDEKPVRDHTLRNFAKLPLLRECPGRIAQPHDARRSLRES